MRYSLRQLEVFLAIARVESVSRAAGALAMSQSAASESLADLEQQFGIKLFDRVGKRLKLNGVGTALRPRVEALLDQAAVLERDLANESGVGRLRVGATLTIGNYLTVPLMARFMRENPGILVTLDVANTEAIALKLTNFEIDVGLIEGELHHPDLRLTVWRDDELSVFCAPHHPLARKKTLDDDDLRSVPWIVRERGSGTRQAFDRAMQGILPELNIALELQHTEAIKRAVEAGLGFGCVSRIALADEFERGSLKPRSVPHRSFRRQFFFVVHAQKFRSAELDRWLDLCRTAQ